MATIQQRHPRATPIVSLASHSDSDEWTVYRKKPTTSSSDRNPYTVHSSEDDEDWHLINDARPKRNLSRFILNPGEKATGSITEILPSPSLVVPRDFLEANDSELDIDRLNPATTTDEDVVPLSSDIESYSHPSPLDVGEESVFTLLPAHDGAGNFAANDMGVLSDSSNASTSTSRSSVVRSQKTRITKNPTGTVPLSLLLEEQRPEEITFPTFDEATDASAVASSLPNILLPDGGITPPSFARRPPVASSYLNSTLPNLPLPPQTPQRQPERRRFAFSLSTSDHYLQHGRLRITTAAQRLLRGAYDPMMVEFRPTITEEKLREALESARTSSTSGDEGSVKSVRRKGNMPMSETGTTDLDSIPTHHPTFSLSFGPSNFPIATSALLQSLWATLRRLTERIIENESASDSFGHLAGEAALEGFLPFGSHLQLGMDSGVSGSAHLRHAPSAASSHSAFRNAPRRGEGTETFTPLPATVRRVGSDCAIESLSEGKRGRKGRRERERTSPATMVGEGGR
ncbi:hypothetical protein BC936DRAFT_143749 [Jimgerdemannia flammicorona]|uniref:Uncharacterized protein n=1 Tax=Jimgerdemannia flammicorona TaxID=994334 RepID=A0A433DDF3_9FUNG|nr:hypothetical protein BC936DRAFT_143749 [Jimgerdemannia flammicorona]